MCLALFAHDVHPRYGLVLAANRDEFYRRPTGPAAFWPDAPQVLAGRDREQGGTWLGYTRGGRIALLTNYREGGAQRADAHSRGLLVSGWLTGEDAAPDFLEAARARDAEYNGYNLIAGDREALWYHSNRSGEIRRLEPGLYGLSNHLLDTPWPKVERSKSALAELLGRVGEALVEGLFAMLGDHSRPGDHELPDTGIGLEWERLLSAAFITSPDYGTRCATVLLVDRDGRVTFVERGFGPGGQPSGEARHAFALEG